MTTSKHKIAKRQGGQAIVMVTLALIAMAAMMGLAVDLGWSYFVQKEAQAAADAAALGAVQATYAALGGNVGSVSCTSGGGNADCVTNTPCSSISAGNLYSGCQYALNNGFSSGGLNSRQQVTLTSSNSSTIPTVPDVTAVKYWVTVRTVQTIPQLFSAVLGNADGTVSAIATAAIAAQIVPGSFYGMNREGDCLSDSSGTMYNCGVDIDITSAGNVTCTFANGSSAGVQAKICAPAGVFLNSQCNGSTLPTGAAAGACGTGNQNYAGHTANNPDVWSASTVGVRGTGAVNIPGNWTPTPTNGAAVTDPTATMGQPPLLTPNSPLSTCAIPGGTIAPGSVLGPYQYYAVDNTGAPTGLPITLASQGNNGAFTFSSTGTCPGTVTYAGATQTNGSFPVYIFYGGVSISGNSANVAFGAGQYVMAGTSSTSGAVLNMVGGTVTGNSSTGTMFVLTDGTYGGALTNQQTGTPLTSLPTLYQGYTQIKNTAIDLTGVTSSAPSTLINKHQNYLFWQDRRNSNVTVDPTNGNVTSQNLPPSANHRTNTSPRFVLDNGNAALRLKGVYYQPRGGWIELQSGGAGVNNSPLQIITGALVTPNGSGNSALTLLGPNAPTIKYVASLIQ